MSRLPYFWELDREAERFDDWSLVAGLVLWCIGVLAMAMGSCGCAPAVSGDALRAATYAAELQQCVAASTTLEESRACRCSVSAKWKRRCDDASDLPETIRDRRSL